MAFDIDAVKATLDDVKHKVWGNGSPGLLDMAARHDERLKTLENVSSPTLSKKEQAALWSGVAGLAVGLAHVIERLFH
jgi:hypothetical protein